MAAADCGIGQDPHRRSRPTCAGSASPAKPAGGYDKKTMAQDVHALAGIARPTRRVGIAGHDIGLMVAYAYAAQYPGRGRPHRADGCVPARRRRLDQGLAAARPLALPFLRRDAARRSSTGRERTYFEHFWNDFAADPHEVRLRGATARFYAKAYAAARRAWRPASRCSRAFEQDAKDFAGVRQDQARRCRCWS